MPSLGMSSPATLPPPTSVFDEFTAMGSISAAVLTLSDVFDPVRCRSRQMQCPQNLLLTGVKV